MTGFISIVVTSLNSIAQLAVVFKMQPAKRTFVLSYFWLPQYFGPSVFRSRVSGFTMLLVGSFGSDAFFEQLPWAAGWNTFQNQKIPPATYSTATRLFCSGRSKMWSHTADSTISLENLISAAHIASSSNLDKCNPFVSNLISSPSTSVFSYEHGRPKIQPYVYV